ncbi:tryptophan halogenase family protein [Pseudoalteromonas maricaloris]|uniref:tryptophan halogenase family protein n=1 Tax=Pseudoalteromonas maricaloris TaxID=184924 RepID=UPI003C1DC4DD
MASSEIKNVVILGGGTAGWLSAALLSKVMSDIVKITVVDSTKIGAVGVGEASIPPLVDFNRALGIDEREFMRKTNATIKLGIQFEGWGRANNSYMHAFGQIGKPFPFCDFYHFWLKSQQLGESSNLWDFSLNYQVAKANKFAPLAKIPNTSLAGVSYAYHFDANLYGEFLKSLSLSRGVVHIDAKVESVSLCPNTGYVTTLCLDDSQQVSGDLFIDCSGLNALLIDRALNVGYDDWSHWLAADSAYALPTALSTDDIAPYTRSIAHAIGWQWQIPLQNRVGNGFVFSSRFTDDQAALTALEANLQGEPLAKPKLIRFKTGMRRKQWHKNVFAIGLSSGFLEPLESTSIHLIQTSIVRLIKHFPKTGFDDVQIAASNASFTREMEQIRDFIILHYKATTRSDSDFWRWCRQMEIPSRLQNKLELFEQTGQLARDEEDLFTEAAWQQVLIGQGIQARKCHPLADQLTDTQRQELFSSLKQIYQNIAHELPTHRAFLRSYLT